MSRRIDIELTSQTADGSWTWRAAGARQPKGVVEGALVPSGEKVGSVLLAEIEVSLEGIEVLSLSEAKPQRSPEKSEGRIEVRGTPKRAPDVSVILAPGSSKRRRVGSIITTASVASVAPIASFTVVAPPLG